MVAEFVKDAESRSPAPVARKISDNCVSRGLLVYPGGHYGNVVAMLPPLIASTEQLATAIQVLGEVLGEIL